MAKFWMLTLGLSFISFSMQAQPGRMDTDRPDQTESPSITKHKYFQVEFGLSLAHEDGFPLVTLPTMLWKYGLLKKLELRLITEINIIETPLLIPDGNEVHAGFIPLQVGGKLSLCEEKGILPKTSLIFHLLIPRAATKYFRASKWAPSFIFTMQHSLSPSIGLGYNIGVEWDGYNNMPSFIYTLSPGIEFGKNWYYFIEIFGSVRKGGEAEHSLDTGFGYYINDNLKLDASAGWGLTPAAIDHFYGVGVSFRFK